MGAEPYLMRIDFGTEGVGIGIFGGDGSLVVQHEVVGYAGGHTGDASRGGG